MGFRVLGLGLSVIVDLGETMDSSMIVQHLTCLHVLVVPKLGSSHACLAS